MLPWQRQFGCHFFYFITYISGARFDEDRSNIYNNALSYFGTVNDVFTFLICIIQKRTVNISNTKDDTVEALLTDTLVSKQLYL